MGAWPVQPGHWVSDGEEEGDMVVRQEGATLAVAGRHYDRCLAVAGERVDAGACSPLETGARLNRDQVSIHHAGL